MGPDSKSIRINPQGQGHYFIGEPIEIREADPQALPYDGDARFNQKTVDQINAQLDVLAPDGGDRLPEATKGPLEKLGDIVEDVPWDQLKRRRSGRTPKSLTKAEEERQQAYVGDDDESKKRSNGKKSGFDTFGDIIIGTRCTGRFDCND